MEGVPGLTAPSADASELEKCDSSGVAAWLLAKECVCLPAPPPFRPPWS